MANAKEELEEALQEIAKLGTPAQILCGWVRTGKYRCDTYVQVELPVGYSASGLSDFFGKLDFLYDDGYGSQELYGVIWFEDGTWLARAEYDGSEWWEHIKCPQIPEILQGGVK